MCCSAVSCAPHHYITLHRHITQHIISVCYGRSLSAIIEAWASHDSDTAMKVGGGGCATVIRVSVSLSCGPVGTVMQSGMPMSFRTVCHCHSGRCATVMRACVLLSCCPVCHCHAGRCATVMRTGVPLSCGPVCHCRAARYATVIWVGVPLSCGPVVNCHSGRCAAAMLAGVSILTAEHYLITSVHWCVIKMKMKILLWYHGNNFNGQ